MTRQFKDNWPMITFGFSVIFMILTAWVKMDTRVTAAEVKIQDTMQVQRDIREDVRDVSKKCDQIMQRLSK